MKKLWMLLMLTVGMSAIVHGKELESFSEISNSLMQGKSIRIVAQCGNSDPNTSTSIFSFFTEAGAVLLRPTYLQFSNTHLTTNYPGFEKKPLLENVTYKISNDGEIHILIRVITLPDYQVQDEHSVICILGRSAKIYTND